MSNPPPNLILIGFMATGKSTIGRWCARALGFRFRDSDTLVERRAGKPVPVIFAEEGEAAFREMEAAAIRDLARGRRVVIATGGGAVMRSTNVAHLRRSGVVVLLRTSPEEILARSGNRVNRPLLASADDPRARVAELLAQREPYYQAAAHLVIDTTGLTREEAAERVLAAYRARAQTWSRPK
jgi:shikimate kinase